MPSAFYKEFESGRRRLGRWRADTVRYVYLSAVAKEKQRRPVAPYCIRTNDLWRNSTLFSACPFPPVGIVRRRVVRGLFSLQLDYQLNGEYTCAGDSGDLRWRFMPYICQRAY